MGAGNHHGVLVSHSELNIFVFVCFLIDIPGKTRPNQCANWFEPFLLINLTFGSRNKTLSSTAIPSCQRRIDKAALGLLFVPGKWRQEGINMCCTVPTWWFAWGWTACQKEKTQRVVPSSRPPPVFWVLWFRYQWWGREWEWCYPTWRVTWRTVWHANPSKVCCSWRVRWDCTNWIGAISWWRIGRWQWRWWWRSIGTVCWAALWGHYRHTQGPSPMHGPLSASLLLLDVI